MDKMVIQYCCSSYTINGETFDLFKPVHGRNFFPQKSIGGFGQHDMKTGMTVGQGRGVWVVVYENQNKGGWFVMIKKESNYK